MLDTLIVSASGSVAIAMGGGLISQGGGGSGMAERMVRMVAGVRSSLVCTDRLESRMLHSRAVVLLGLPVVVLTASKLAEDIHKSRELGVYDYRVKPNAFEDLVRVLDDVRKCWLDERFNRFATSHLEG